jgi:hypothetical protein
MIKRENSSANPIIAADNSICDIVLYELHIDQNPYALNMTKKAFDKDKLDLLFINPRNSLLIIF